MYQYHYLLFSKLLSVHSKFTVNIVLILLM